MVKNYHENLSLLTHIVWLSLIPPSTASREVSQGLRTPYVWRDGEMTGSPNPIAG